jgi:hypothetical protein
LRRGIATKNRATGSAIFQKSGLTRRKPPFCIRILCKKRRFLHIYRTACQLVGLKTLRLAGFLAHDDEKTSPLPAPPPGWQFGRGLPELSPLSAERLTKEGQLIRGTNITRYQKSQRLFFYILGRSAGSSGFLY